MQHEINDREEYQKGVLLEKDVLANPVAQFSQWFEKARQANIYEPYAMTLATVDQHAQPSARIVLLRGFGEDGFKFFTNYTSRKGHELAHNDRASLLFYWAELEQQVRIEGRVAKLPNSESDAYYHSRPVGNRLGAWASPQSQVITRDELLAAQKAFSQKLGDQPPRPPHWGGYALVPEYFEFWQGQPSRLHDRIIYRKPIENSSNWLIERIAP